MNFLQCFFFSFSPGFRVRQRSGEGVVRRNGCPKGCFWRVRFFSAPLRLTLKHLKCPENLKGAKKKRTLQKHPFWTTVSPHDAFAAPLAHSENLSVQFSEEIAPKMWRKLPDFPRQRKKRRLLSHLWLSYGFFGPE